MLHNYKNINGLVFDFCFHNENGACLLRLGLQRSLALTKPQRAAIYTAQVLLIKVCFPVYLSSGFSGAFCEQQRDAPVMDRILGWDEKNHNLPSHSCLIR